MPKIVASATTQLYEELPILNYVETKYESEAKQQGDIIWVPNDNSDMTVYDVIPGHLPTNESSIRNDGIPIVLNNWKEVVFDLDDKQLREISLGVIPQAITTKVRGLRNAIAQSVWDQYKQSHIMIGTPGQTPFDPDVDKLTLAKQAKRILNDNLANSVSRNRVMLLDTEAESNASMLPEFLNVDRAGTDITMREGVIGRKLGFEWTFDNTDTIHPANTLSTRVGFSIGTTPTSIIIENPLLPQMNPQTRNIVTIAAPVGATGGFKKGDIITVASDATQTTYVVENDANINAGTVQLQFYPAPKGTWTVNSAITIKAGHKVNLCMHDKAIALVMAPFNKVGDQPRLGSNKLSMQFIDPVYRIPLRLEVYEQYKRTYWSIDAIWGVKTIYRNHLIRMAG